MKTLIKLLFTAGFAVAASGSKLAGAEVNCSPRGPGEPDGCDMQGENCELTIRWTEPVDLDGDGAADFLHRRVTASVICGDEYAWYWRNDEIEAFYPEEHVDVWIQYHTSYPTDPYWAVAVQPGEVVGDPSYQDCGRPTFLCRTWASERPVALPTLQAEGLGVIYRRTDRYPCPPDNPFCSEVTCVGAVRLANPTDYSVEALFGFRIQQPEGWHLGWLRLEFHHPWPTLLPPHKDLGGVFLLDYAIHPEPDTPIVAGEPARPTLHAVIEGDQVILNWHPAWTDYRLERSLAVTGSSWEAIPGVENNTLRLPKSGPPAFFRLTQTPEP